MRNVSKWVRTAAVVVGLSLATAGCSDSSGVTAPDPPQQSTATLIVANQTAESIFYVYFTPCDDGSWGSDQLGSSEVIASGASRSWTVNADCYDLRAVASSSAEAERHGVQLTPGLQFTWTITD